MQQQGEVQAPEQTMASAGSEGLGLRSRAQRNLPNVRGAMRRSGERLRQRSSEARRSFARSTASTSAQTSSLLRPRKSFEAQLADERQALQPLVLGVSDAGRFFAYYWHAWLWQIFGGAWIEPMFLRKTAPLVDDGVDPVKHHTHVGSWGPSDLGLYRASSSIHMHEPWNRERLHLQLQRAAVTSPPAMPHKAEGTLLTLPDGTVAGMQEAELLADEDREIMDCSLGAWHMVGQQMDAQAGRALRLRSHHTSQRSQLHMSMQYDLRVDITSITLLKLPQRNAKRGYDVFDSAEGRSAAELQQVYRLYREQADADPISLLDARLDALFEHGRILRQALEEPAQNPSGGQTTAVSAELSAAREAFTQHLEARNKLRQKRDQTELHLEALGRSLYGKWKDVRHARQTQGYTSTPWRLQAQVEEHSSEADMQRRMKNINAEEEEVVWLQGLPRDRARSLIEQRWDQQKRPPGAVSYRFEVSATEEVTPTEWLEARVREERQKERASDTADPRYPDWKAECLRRRRLRQIHVRVACKVGDRVVSRSAPSALHWESGSTAAKGTLIGSERDQAAVSEAMHTFDIPMLTMPSGVSLMVEVAVPLACGMLKRWAVAAEVTADVPGVEGRRVTHAASLKQIKAFGSSVPVATATGESAASPTGEDEPPEDVFVGQVAFCVSWPGASTAGNYVVPPRSDGEAGAAEQSRSALLPSKLRPAPAKEGDGGPAGQDGILEGLKFDPQDPDNARMLVPKPGAHGEAQDQEPGLEETCALAPSQVDVLLQKKRVQMILERTEHEAVEADAPVIPAFEYEADANTDQAAAGEFGGVSSPRAALLSETEAQRDFVRRVRGRIHKVAAVKTHLSYNTIVREYMAEGEEMDLFALFRQLQQLLLPKRTLRPHALKPRPEASARFVRVHVSLSKVYNAPIRNVDDGGASHQGSAPTSSSGWNAGGPRALNSGGYASGYGAGGVPGAQPSFWQGGGFGSFPFGHNQQQPLGGFSAGGAPSVLGQSSLVGVSRAALPELVVEMSFEDFSGRVLHRRTARVTPSTDPDINQTVELTLGASGMELSQEKLRHHDTTLTFTIFDEVMAMEPERGNEVKMRRERRYLGRLRLPWTTLLETKGTMKGHFRVERPPVIFGYRPKPRPIGGDSAPRAEGRSLEPEPMFMSFDVTMDPALMPPRATQPRIIRGKEPSVVLKHVNKWLESFGQQAGIRRWLQGLTGIGLGAVLGLVWGLAWGLVAGLAWGLSQALAWCLAWGLLWTYLGVGPGASSSNLKRDCIIAVGTDLDGRSRLVCRFIRAQKPPSHIDLDGPSSAFAIEEAARYVSLIPFLDDCAMFPGLTDLWCTDQETLNIQCGDWEEHAILLCNYFNFIDRHRRQKVDGYGSSNIESYCALCTLLPEGEVMMVLRRNADTGDCELWQAVSGDCYFIPYHETTVRRRCYGLFGWGEDQDEGETTTPDAAPSSSQSAGTTTRDGLRPTPSIPVKQVHLLFNSTNVWANIQVTQRRNVRAGIRKLNFDVTRRDCWKPLFATPEEEELLYLPVQDMSMLNTLNTLNTTLGSPGRRRSSTHESQMAAETKEVEAASPQRPERVEDMAQPLIYEPVDENRAAFVERQLEDQLERQILEYRSTGEHGGVQQVTRFNSVISKRLAEILDQLERYTRKRRRTGNEATFPLRSHAPPPVTLEDVQDRLRDAERDFRGADHRGRRVYGVPFNQPYTDFKRLWECVRDSRVLEMGNEAAEYAVKIRVYPYESRILSVWVFVACVTSNN